MDFWIRSQIVTQWATVREAACSIVARGIVGRKRNKDVGGPNVVFFVIARNKYSGLLNA